MATSKKVLRDGIKAVWMDKMVTFLREGDEDVQVFGSNKFAIPVVDAEGNEDWLTVTLSIPTGNRETGEQFDGYEAAQNWRFTVEQKKQKAADAAAKKEKKIAADKAKREAAKAEKEEGE